MTHAKLFELLNAFPIRYPTSIDGEPLVIPVPSCPARRIKGRAFFPGGSGHSEGEVARLPANPIFTLGDNFGSWGYYTKCVLRGEEPLDNPTWKDLLEIYEQAGLDPQCCFHSNVYMGFIPGESNSKEKMFVTKEFRCDCESFLTWQIRTITPKAIIALGSKAKDALADISPEIQIVWGSKSYNDLYLDNSLLLQNSSIPIGQGNWHGDVITIMHPALRKGNLGKSRKRLGIDAESIELESLRKFASRNS
jgi:hypothetical protein